MIWDYLVCKEEIKTKKIKNKIIFYLIFFLSKSNIKSKIKFQAFSVCKDYCW